MADYCQESDLNLAYGRANVQKWADLDNENNATSIAARISWAITYASDYIDTRLIRSPYAVPFSSPYPRQIVYLAALQAGMMLFKGRRVISDESENQMSAQAQMIERLIAQILNGQVRLMSTTGSYIDKEDYNAPKAVSGSKKESIDYTVYDPFYRPYRECD